MILIKRNACVVRQASDKSSASQGFDDRLVLQLICLNTVKKFLYEWSSLVYSNMLKLLPTEVEFFSPFASSSYFSWKLDSFSPLCSQKITTNPFHYLFISSYILNLQAVVKLPVFGTCYDNLIILVDCIWMRILCTNIIQITSTLQKQETKAIIKMKSTEISVKWICEYFVSTWEQILKYNWYILALIILSENKMPALKWQQY